MRRKNKKECVYKDAKKKELGQVKRMNEFMKERERSQCKERE